MYGSSIDNIKNVKLRELVTQVIKHASSTVSHDMLDAFSESESDEDFTANWQSKLEGLKNEVEHYWSGLEGMKSQKAPEADFKRDMPELHREMKFDQ